MSNPLGRLATRPHLDEILTVPVGFPVPEVGQRNGVVEPIVCKDGTKISVQASHFHYCSPRTDEGPWTAVEIGYPTAPVPRSWGFDGMVAGYVPVEKVRAFIKRHGGEA